MDEEVWYDERTDSLIIFDGVQYVDDTAYLLLEAESGRYVGAIKCDVNCIPSLAAVGFISLGKL